MQSLHDATVFYVTMHLAILSQGLSLEFGVLAYQIPRHLGLCKSPDDGELFIMYFLQGGCSPYKLVKSYLKTYTSTSTYIYIHTYTIGYMYTM